MSKFRSLQFLRNQTIANVANHGEARSNFAGVSLTNVKDGEIILYSYKITDEEVSTGVHTLVGVVREINSVKHLEILGNYDFLHNEIVNALAEAKTYTDTKIANLNNTITNHEEGGEEPPVIVSITQTNGLLTSVKVDAENLSTEFQKIINALDYTHADANNLAQQPTDKKSFNIYATNQVDGQISEVVDGTIYFTDGVTSTNPGATKKYVDDSINALNTPEGGVSSADNQNILVTVVQENGIVTHVSVDETTLEARLDAIEDNTITGEDAIVVTPDTTTGNNVVTLKIANGEQVLSQGAEGNEGLKTTLTVDTIKYGEDAGDKAGKTYIQIKGIGGEVISETDAAAFVKDGFLQSVTKDEEANTITFTWNTDAGIQATTISIKELCDVYTAKENDWILLNGYEFSHKTVDSLDSGVAHGITTDVTVNSTTEKTFKVPTLTVDAAGHVVSVDEKTVTITLPESIDTAVQTINGHTINDSFITTTVTPSDDNTTQQINVTAKLGTFPAEDVEVINGLATVADVVDYVQANSTTVSGYTKTVGEGESAVSTVVTEVVESSNENGSTNYQVKLPEIAVTNTTVTNTMADDTATHSYITSIETDGFGRVVKTVTETMTEDINCGYWD